MLHIQDCPLVIKNKVCPYCKVFTNKDIWKVMFNFIRYPFAILYGIFMEARERKRESEREGIPSTCSMWDEL